MSKFQFRKFIDTHKGEVFSRCQIKGSRKSNFLGVSKKWTILNKDAIAHLTGVFNQWLQAKMLKGAKVVHFNGVNKHVIRKWVVKRIEEERMIWNKDKNRLKILKPS